MIVEVIAVGTELLIGQIVNTNAATIGGRLADEGFDAHYQVTVGDNLERLTGSILEAMRRADAVILTGGIGPTRDDLTREAICAATGRAMARDEAHAETIRRRVLARRAVFADSALRMAEYPEGAEPLPNSQGVALGVALLHKGTWIFAVPGVPREMQALMDEEVLPRLRQAAGGPRAIRSRVLRTWGYGESRVAELLDDLYESTNPSIAFLISDMEVKVRITAKAGDQESAEAMTAPFEDEVRERLGPAVFASDDETVLDVIRRHSEARDWSLAVCEIGTDGHVGSQLASAGIDGFVGGIIGREAEAGAVELADRARSTFSGDVGLGVSAPTVVDDDGHDASLLSFGVVTPESSMEREMRFFGTGERARSYAVIAALHHLRLGLSGEWWE